jgi:hypothetical protein
MVIESAVGVATAIEVLPDFVTSCVDVAVIVAGPEAAGVNTPEEVIVPSVAVQVTPELYALVPCTVAEHWLVWPVFMLAGVQETLTDVMVGDAGGVLPLPPHPAIYNAPRNERVNKLLHVMRASSKPDCPGEIDRRKYSTGNLHDFSSSTV